MIVIDGQPPESASPFPRPVVFELNHSKGDRRTPFELERSHRRGRDPSGRFKRSIPNVLRPAGPSCDLRKMIPCPFKRRFDPELPADELDHLSMVAQLLE